MSALQVSRLLRLALETRFASLFNDALAAACEEFEVAELAFAINFDGSGAPQNFYRGDRSIDSLNSLQEPDLPALAMWTGEGQNLLLEMPRDFSGKVRAYWRFFLFIDGVRTAGLTDLREAVEAAMLATLKPEFSAVHYSGDIGWEPLPEQSLLNQDERHFGWLQQVTYSASFEVNV